MQNQMNQEPTQAGQKKSFFRAVVWVLLVVGIGVGVLAGFYLRPLLTPTVKADTVAQPVIEKIVVNNDVSPQENVDVHEVIMQTVVSSARHFDGDPNAPITLVEFADFNCGYCGKWALETLPQIKEKYIDTGKVQIAYVNYPVLGDNSVLAAESSECAAQQDKFWEYHTALYQNRGGGFSPDSLTDLAGDIGMDTDTFAQCLATFPADGLESDMLLGQVMGIRGTPAFLINGIALPGAYPYEQFEQIIEALLAE